MSSIPHHDQTIPSPPPAEAQAAAGSGHWLRQAAPTAAVIAALAALAAWGHFNEWKLPKFSELTGQQDQKTDEWCDEHSVPESQCIECNKSLVSLNKNAGWCPTCGIAPCPLHQQGVAQLANPPSISAEDIERTQRTLALRPRIENNSLCTLHEKRIQFASIEAISKAGVDVDIVKQRPMIEAITANGEVTYDQTRTALLASRVAGTVARVEKQIGDPVHKGDVLALIDAAAVGKAKEEFLQAIAQLRLKQATVDRLRPLAAEKVIPGIQLRQAETALQEAQIRLEGAQQALINLDLAVRTDDLTHLDADQISTRIRSLGLPRPEITRSAQESSTANLFPLRAPQDGVVVSCKVVPGSVVDTSTVIFGIADVSQMWLTLNVRQDDAKYLSLGQTVLFRPNSGVNEAEIKGSLAWISTEADDQTRTAEVRVNLPNDEGRLLAHTFGTGRIVLREEPQAIVVPSQAVHRDGDCNVVFVRDKNFFKEGAPKFFHIRKVRVGVKEGDQTEIIAGLLPGEVIASENSVVLQAQLLKGNLGEGCGHHH
jgi:cobalt-zinc-cadmium efflux system membrane fusion protein